MRINFLVGVYLLCTLTCFGQKPSIDTNAIKNWASVSGGNLSNDGMYAMYTIKNQSSDKQILVVMGTKKSWKVELSQTSGRFTTDSKYVIFKRADSLGILKTGGDIVRYIPFVQSYSISENGNAKWLLYQLNSSPQTLRVYDLETGKEKTIDFVKQYLLSEDGNTLLYLTEEKNDTRSSHALQLLSLPSGDTKTIWQGNKAENITWNESRQQIAFVIEGTSRGQLIKTVYYFKVGMDSPTELTTSLSIEKETKLQLEKIGSFSKDGSYLGLTLKQQNPPKSLPSPVDIWSYTDLELQSSSKENKINRTPTYLSSSGTSYQAVINLQNNHLFRLQNDDKEVVLPQALQGYSTGDCKLVFNIPGDFREAYWNVRARASVFLMSVKDGRRIKILGSSGNFVSVSPEEKYVLYFNPEEKNWFSYEIKSGIIRNLTKNLPVKWMGYGKDFPTSDTEAKNIAGWLANDEGVLLYDENDIWQIDMSGNKAAVNVTNGCGKRNNIVFALDLGEYQSRAILPGERLIINAFNQGNKENGWYSKMLSKTGDPELLSMGPYLYHIPGNPYVLGGAGYSPYKAKDAEVYLVRRTKSNEAADYFVTSDFKTFKQLSDVQPQKKYNWLTSELINWKGLDGRSLQGILYKPENFDPQKKYPVILHYYERRSDGLHAFLEPGIITAGMNINIPWYVSKGYLVFVPDIHYKIGETGESARSSIVSAAQYLSKFSYVNPKKMGIQGGSYGAFQTNYIVTHSNLFAAACSASGVSDLVSGYGSLMNSGESMQSKFESGQHRIGATLWQRPDLYIKNSPIFKADKITTPLLIMHTREDGTCLFPNAIEFFTALRRLDKKVWMLQYEGNHGVDGQSAIDYSTRMQQFFDHSLKDAPAPVWMTKGIPAKLKGIENGLAYDPAGNCGKQCSICNSWNEKMKQDAAATMQEIERRRKEEHWQ